MAFDGLFLSADATWRSGKDVSVEAKCACGTQRGLAYAGDTFYIGALQWETPHSFLGKCLLPWTDFQEAKMKRLKVNPRLEFRASLLKPCLWMKFARGALLCPTHRKFSRWEVSVILWRRPEFVLLQSFDVTLGEFSNFWDLSFHICKMVPLSHLNPKWDVCKL